MMFVTGGLAAGKRSFVRDWFGWSDDELAAHAVWDVQECTAAADDLSALADELAAFDVVIATEVGGGVVPIDPEMRAAREAAGRLACLLSERAETVVRVCCGLPQVLKGTLPARSASQQSIQSDEAATEGDTACASK